MGFFDEILDLIRGQPPQSSVVFPDPVLPPLYNQISQWGPLFNQLWGRSLPSYQGRIDPGLSPTLQNLIQMSQGYATSGAPQSMQMAQGALGRYTMPGMASNPTSGMLGGYYGGGRGLMGGGDINAARSSLLRFMQPQWMNPASQLQYGSAPNYFGGQQGGGMVGRPMAPQFPQQGGSQMGNGGVPPGWGGGQMGLAPQFAQLQQMFGGQRPGGWTPRSTGAGGASDNALVGSSGLLNMGYRGDTFGQRYGAGSAGRGDARNAGLGYIAHNNGPEVINEILRKGIGHDILKPYGYQGGDLTQRDIFDIGATRGNQSANQTAHSRIQNAWWQSNDAAAARENAMATMDPAMRAAFLKQIGMGGGAAPPPQQNTQPGAGLADSFIQHGQQQQQNNQPGAGLGTSFIEQGLPKGWTLQQMKEAVAYGKKNPNWIPPEVQPYMNIL